MTTNHYDDQAATYNAARDAADAGTRAKPVRAAQLPRLAFTAMEAPAVLGVSWDFFREHIAPELRWVRRGSKKLVALAELEAWLEREAAKTLDDAA